MSCSDFPAALSRVMASVSPSISDSEDLLMEGLYYYPRVISAKQAPMLSIPATHKGQWYIFLLVAWGGTSSINDYVYNPTRFLEDILTKYSDAHTVLTRLKLEINEAAKHETGYKHHKINSDVIKKLDDLSHVMFMEELISIKDGCLAINLKISNIENAIW